MKLLISFILIILGFVNIFPVAEGQTDWKEYLKKPAAWFGSDEAVKFGDDIVKYQNPDGGWKKIMNSEGNGDWSKSTIDNECTYSQIRVLAKIYNKTNDKKYRDSCIKGINCLLENQYENGGWAQVFKSKNYHTHITYNDNAMINVMILLDEIAKDKNPDFKFLSDDDNLRKSCRKAIKKGIECILKTQIIVNGKKTAWCQQHDKDTLKPTPARSFELISITACESVGLVRFLMKIENPSDEIKESIQSAVEWFNKVKITGKKIETINGGKTLIDDPDAPPIWSRFYEIDTNKPFFCGRDGVKKYSLAEIESERANGYAWYGNWPSKLEKEYSAWTKRYINK